MRKAKTLLKPPLTCAKCSVTSQHQVQFGTRTIAEQDGAETKMVSIEQVAKIVCRKCGKETYFTGSLKNLSD
jgi:hypothetical protein